MIRSPGRASTDESEVGLHLSLSSSKQCCQQVLTLRGRHCPTYTCEDMTTATRSNVWKSIKRFQHQAQHHGPAACMS